MTSLLLAIYCVTPATSSENIDHPSFLREVGSVQTPCTLLKFLSFVVRYKLITGIRSSHFFYEGRAVLRALPQSTT